MLVEYKGNYSDEFDVTGFKIMTDNELDEYMDKVKARLESGPIEWYFGSNEYIMIEHFDDFQADFTATPLGHVDLKVLNSLFPSAHTYSYGFFPSDIGDY